MSRVLEEARPHLLLELHGPESASSVWEILTEAGYRLQPIIPGAPAVTDPGELDWKAYLLGTPIHDNHE
jgi:hypothetical protein